MRRNTQGIIETTALANNEWKETKDKSTPLYSINPSTIKNLKKESIDFSHVIPMILPFLTHFRILLQRSRTDWYSLANPTASKENADRLNSQLSQKNVYTAMEKLKFPETAYGKTLREQYDVICDFVHPNRGSHMLFVNESIQKNDFIEWVYTKNPSSIELVQIVLDVTAIPIIHCLSTAVTTYQEWNALLEHLCKVIDGSRNYLP